MRVLLSEESKKILKRNLLENTDTDSLRELSKKLKVPKGTLDEWFYNKKRYIPEKVIHKGYLNKLDILDKKKDNWGQIKGGEEAYKKIIKKYGKEEMRKRQIRGGKNSAKKRGKIDFNLKLKNPLFLEFYGALLGDGWMSRLSYEYNSGKKNLWWVGISGHKKLDKQYLEYLMKIVTNLFNRKPTIKYKKESKGMEFIFSCKQLILYLKNKLGFPVGKKKNLKIPPFFVEDWDKLRHIVRGIFDTDGCFYLDKTPANNPYPCISIEMKAPILIKQLYKSLLGNNFKIVYKEKIRKQRITLKGRKQLDKWMEEIGSSNLKHLDKINALVAQQDSATPS